MKGNRRYARRVWLDALPDRVKEEVLADKVEVRDETTFGLEPRRWGQVALLFSGEKGQDVLYCIARGLNTTETGIYLGTSERTVRNVLNGFLSRLQAIQGGAGIQAQMFNLPEQTDEFAPDRRPPTRRGRPRRTATVEAQAEAVEVEMCY